MKKAQKQNLKEQKSIEKEIRTEYKDLKQKLLRVVDQLMRAMSSLKHDLRDSRPLRDTSHPQGMVELAAMVTQLVIELKANERMRGWISR